MDRRCVKSGLWRRPLQVFGVISQRQDEGEDGGVARKENKLAEPWGRSAAGLKRREPAAAFFCVITCLIYFASQKLWAMTEPI